MLNTEEFYKALMERYTFDEDKIRQAAIKQAKQPAIQKFAMNYWKPAAGIAAAVAVTVGVTAYASRSMSGPDGGLTVIVSPASALSASERLHEAELSYYNATSEEEEIKDVYITFRYDVSYNDIVLALSSATDTDDIKIDCVYTGNGASVVSDETVSNGNRRDIAAAKVSAPMRLYRSIQDLSIVYLAELGSADINDETFVPIEIDDNDPLINDISLTAPVATTQFSFSQTTPAPEVTEPQPEDIEDVEADAPDMTTLPPDENEPDAPDATEVPEDDGEETDVDETETAPAETSAPAETTTPAPEVPVTELPTTVEPGLMTELYTLNVPNALETVLVDHYAVVLTKTEVYVYSIGGVIKTDYTQKAEMTSPKVAYSDKKTVIVTGCGSDGKRNAMLYLNAATGNVGLIDAAPFIADSEIGTIQYSASTERFFIKTVSSTGTYVYEFSVDAGMGVRFRPLVESPSAISLAGSKGDMLYFTTTNENGKYVLYEFNCGDGTSKELAIFDCSLTVKSSQSFGSFTAILSDNSAAYIFDVATASLIRANVDADSPIATINGKTFFKNSDGTYAISDGIISEYDGPEIGFGKKALSEYSISSTDSEKVTVMRDRSRWR